MLCDGQARRVPAFLDNGHYHPTERVSDKISSMLVYFDKLPLHVTRPVRWDSDHVVLLEDELIEIAKELVRNDALERALIGLDFLMRPSTGSPPGPPGRVVCRKRCSSTAAAKRADAENARRWTTGPMLLQEELKNAAVWHGMGTMVREAGARLGKRTCGADCAV